jgi:hypothetical protein
VRQGAVRCNETALWSFVTVVSRWAVNVDYYDYGASLAGCSPASGSAKTEQTAGLRVWVSGRGMLAFGVAPEDRLRQVTGRVLVPDLTAARLSDGRRGARRRLDRLQWRTRTVGAGAGAGAVQCAAKRAACVRAVETAGVAVYAMQRQACMVDGDVQSRGPTLRDQRPAFLYD